MPFVSRAQTLRVVDWDTIGAGRTASLQGADRRERGDAQGLRAERSKRHAAIAAHGFRSECPAAATERAAAARVRSTRRFRREHPFSRRPSCRQGVGRRRRQQEERRERREPSHVLHPPGKPVPNLGAVPEKATSCTDTYLWGLTTHVRFRCESSVLMGGPCGRRSSLRSQPFMLGQGPRCDTVINTRQDRLALGHRSLCLVKLYPSHSGCVFRFRGST